MKFKPVREKYLAHIEKMFALAGVAAPQETAARVLAVETELASHHWDRVKRRDRTLSYNKKDRKQLETLAPGVDWSVWLTAYGAKEKDIREVIVRQPEYFSGLAAMLDKVALSDWKAWLTWHLLHRSAPYLSRPFVEEEFAFFGRPDWSSGESSPLEARCRAGRQSHG